MNVEKVIPKSLEPEKAAEYALAVCEEGLGKSGVKTKNLGGGSFGTAVGVTFGDGIEAVVKFLRADGMLEKETHDLCLCLKLRRAYAESIIFPQRRRQHTARLLCYGQNRGQHALYVIRQAALFKKREAGFRR